MAQKNPSRSLVTSEFRMSFPHVITAHPYTENGKPTGKEAYQTEGIFLEDALKSFKMYDETANGGKGAFVDVDIRQVLVELAKEAWGNQPLVIDEANNITEPFSVKRCFELQRGKGWPIVRGEAIKAKREAKGKKVGDQYDGMFVMNFKSNKTDNIQPPTLSMVTGKTTFKTLERASDADMQKAKLLFSGGNYAFATISVVAMTVSGTRFLTPYLNGIRYTREGKKLGGESLMDRFDGYQGGAAAHNPAEGMDDEIPF